MRGPIGWALPVDTCTLALSSLPTSPSRARRYTRSFLDSCQEISPDTVEAAELIVSELVTNAVKYAGEPASPISLSLQNFREVVRIEAFDTGSNPPVLSSADGSAGSGRGLMLVNALSKEWSYSFRPDGGKIVYCFVEKT